MSFHDRAVGSLGRAAGRAVTALNGDTVRTEHPEGGGSTRGRAQDGRPARQVAPVLPRHPHLRLCEAGCGQGPVLTGAGQRRAPHRGAAWSLLGPARRPSSLLHWPRRAPTRQDMGGGGSRFRSGSGSPQRPNADSRDFLTVSRTPGHRATCLRLHGGRGLLAEGPSHPAS